MNRGITKASISNSWFAIDGNKYEAQYRSTSERRSHCIQQPCQKSTLETFENMQCQKHEHSATPRIWPSQNQPISTRREGRETGESAVLPPRRFYLPRTNRCSFSICGLLHRFVKYKVCHPIHRPSGIHDVCGKGSLCKLAVCGVIGEAALPRSEDRGRRSWDATLECGW